MNINEAGKRVCPFTFNGKEFDNCYPSNCMAWQQSKKEIQTEHKSENDKPYLAISYEPDPENGYCAMMPKGVE